MQKVNLKQTSTIKLNNQYICLAKLIMQATACAAVSFTVFRCYGPIQESCYETMKAILFNSFISTLPGCSIALISTITNLCSVLLITFLTKIKKFRSFFIPCLMLLTLINAYILTIAFIRIFSLQIATLMLSLGLVAISIFFSIIYILKYKPDLYKPPKKYI